jgi:acetyl-CoA carboxylase biotin carboxyl carrier protein
MPKLQVDKALIRELSQLLDETNLTEIELCEGSKSVRVVRTAAAPVMAAAPALLSASVAAPADPAAAPPVRADAADEPGAVRSPMVGTVYLSAEPGGVPFVKVGDTVAQGQTLLIIEAMKVMNQIPAPRAGTVKKVLVEDAQPTEYGDILVVIG